MLRPLFIVSLLIIFSQCVSKDTEKNKPVHLPKKSAPVFKTKNAEKEPALVVKTDTINKENAVAFLEAYGNKHPETLVVFETRLGAITIKLYRDTPLHRASFIFLTKTGYFSTTCFHRVVAGFIVQGGNSDHPITRKKRIQYNYRIPAEIKPYHKHKYGALAAARQWENNPDKVSSPFEFYMIQDKRGSHHLDGEHTIFGEIIREFSVMEKIALLETDKKEWPVKDVFIKASVVE